jgi:hypothetical protein
MKGVDLLEQDAVSFGARSGDRKERKRERELL